jgi:hypothetical protein
LSFSCRTAGEQLDGTVLPSSQETGGKTAAIAGDEVHAGFGGGAQQEYISGRQVLEVGERQRWRGKLSAAADQEIPESG